MALTAQGRPRLLALRALGLGDAVTGIAALRGVRRRWPDHHLVLAAPSVVGDWLRQEGLVDEVLDTRGLERRDWQGDPPDVAVNLHGRGPQSHALLQRLHPSRLVAFANAEAGFSDGPPWRANEHEVDRWCRLLASAGATCGPDDLRLGEPPGGRGRDARLVLIHPGAAFPSRRWPADRWAAVARDLAEQGRQVLVTGVPEEAQACAAVAAAHPAVEDTCGRYAVPQLSALVRRAGLLLCGDTGIAHLATAHGTPSVLLFGPVAPTEWGPRLDPELHRVLWEPRPGDPPGDPHARDVDVRLARIEVAQVLAAADEITPAAATSGSATAG
ncbi:MAG TPA: glycosyltransferase family 9 protein [Segeticoccus sp.]|uniref:glycosyltransferase family 9 protein n=1 Tax=Segeticoccus sp. TaxID=2706531 RepID=UPI002D7ED091|nr:glycosyltransferase family 9 protein [Segeticoccus sp.]HET8600759.1 glycosyltransferase family 9 protein [Segeticoccus sp.]